MIRKLGQEYQEQVKLIQTVPGFKEELSALRIISEIGADMTVFNTAGKLCSWSGLVPANNESAGNFLLVFRKVVTISNLFLFK